MRRRKWRPVSAILKANGISVSEAAEIARLLDRKVSARWVGGQLWLDGESADVLQAQIAALKGARSEGAIALQNAGISAAVSAALAAALDRSSSGPGSSEAWRHVRVSAGCQGAVLPEVATASEWISLPGFYRAWEETRQLRGMPDLPPPLSDPTDSDLVPINLEADKLPPKAALQALAELDDLWHERRRQNWQWMPPKTRVKLARKAIEVHPACVLDHFRLPVARWDGEGVEIVDRD